MALKAEIASLDGLPEAVAREYKKVEEGGKTVFRLDVEKVGGLELADTGGLLSTIEKLRGFEARSARYGNITPEEAAANAKKVTDLTAELDRVRKDVNGGDDRVRQVRKELEDAHAAAMATATQTADMRLAEVIRLRRDQAALSAVQAAGFRTTAKLMARLLMDEIEVSEDPKATDPEKRFVTTIKGEHGPRRVVRKGEDGDRLMTPHERALELAAHEDFKRFVDAEEDPKKPKPGQKPAKNATQNQPPRQSGSDDAFDDMGTIEELVAARGGTID